MKAPRTLQQAIIYFADANNCLTYMALRRWPNGVKLPHLWPQRRPLSSRISASGSARASTPSGSSPLRLEPSLKTPRWASTSGSPPCGLSPIARTESPATRLAKDIGVTQKTAWFMLHRIREAMKSGSLLKMGGSNSAPIEVDETFIGGRAKNMHAARRNALKAGLKAGHKTAVMGMLDRDSRQVRAMVVPNVRRETLQNEILNQIEGKSTVYTDGSPAYDLLSAKAIRPCNCHPYRRVRSRRSPHSGHRKLLEPVEARPEWNLCCR